VFQSISSWAAAATGEGLREQFPNMGAAGLVREHALPAWAGLPGVQDPPLLLLDPAPGKPVPAVLACRLGYPGVPGRGGSGDMVLDVRSLGHVPELRGSRPGRPRAWRSWDSTVTSTRLARVPRRSVRPLCRELSIPILGPEIAAAGIYTRADWIQRGASDMSASTSCGRQHRLPKMAAICERLASSARCTIAALATLQILGATSETSASTTSTAWTRPAWTANASPYLEAICDPVALTAPCRSPRSREWAYRLRWDYIEEHRVGS